MRITAAELRLVPLRLRELFEISSGGRQDRKVILLTLEAEGVEAGGPDTEDAEAGSTQADGAEAGGGTGAPLIGWSECVAAEDPGYSYETTETAWHVLTDFLLPSVVGMEIEEPGDILDPIAWVRGHRMARAAVEMAAWDLHARSRGVSLTRALGAEPRPVEVGVSVGLQPTDADLLHAVEGYVAEGYRRIKIKIKPGRDVEMLKAVRSRFPDTPLMADANSAYTLADAHHLARLDELGLMMVEQPLAWDDLEDHARLQDRLETPICLDESIRSVRDASLALRLGSCRIINIKPGRVGGFASARAIHDLCVDHDVPVWCGGMLESGVGRAHNVALASLPGFTLPGDISASRRYWKRDIVDPEFEVVDGTLSVPDRPGMGVEPDVERIEELTVRRERFS